MVAGGLDPTLKKGLTTVQYSKFVLAKRGIK